jgi:hypothetical protein
MHYFWLGVIFLVSGYVGSYFGFRWTIQQTNKAVQSLIESAWGLSLSSQRLNGEIALTDGLVRDLAHHQGLHYADAAHDDDLPDDLAHGLNYKFLEGDE